MSELHHEAQEAVDEAKLVLLAYERADSSMLYRAHAEILDALDTQERQSIAGNRDRCTVPSGDFYRSELMHVCQKHIIISPTNVLH